MHDVMRRLEARDLSRLSWKEKLAYIGVEMLTGPQVPAPVMHFFQPGWYIREMFIPADTVFIGREHRFGHECQLVSGTVLHITESDRREITAPFTMHSTPGYQMVLQALTDIIGRTIYPNPSNSRDIDALEEEMFRLPEELTARGYLAREKLRALQELR